MNTRFLYLILLFWLPVSFLKAQQCQSGGNIVIFSNYDGGYLTIDVNQDIPNLKVGICSYEPVEVQFTGAFVGNITEVVYAGYNPLTGTGNFHCDNNLAVTTVATPPNATVTILNYPAVTLISPDVPLFPGSTFLISAGDNNGITSCSSCENDTYQGGSNTAEQIADFFATQFNGEVLFLKTQYDCWCGVQNLDIPPDCCTELNPAAAVSIGTDSGNASLCAGSSLVLNAGAGYLSYNWSTGATTPSITVTAPGAYAVTVTSTCGTASDILQITEDEAPDLSIDLTPDYGCLGGSLQVGVNNPSGNYLFSLVDAGGNSIPSPGGVAIDLNAGTYTLTVASVDSGCSTTETIDIPGSDPFVVQLAAEDASCNSSDGTITIDFTAFLPDNYTYTLLSDGGQTIASGAISASTSIPNLAPGAYAFSITGVNTPCQFDAVVLIEGSALVLAGETVTDVLCGGAATGSIDVQVEGGDAPYSYLWTDANGAVVGTDAVLSAVPAGVYALEVEDNSGCLATFSWEIAEPPMLTLAATTQAISCPDAADGVIDLTASGGVGPYLFALDGENFQAGGSFSGLAPGSFIPAVEDANGCQAEGNALSLEAPPALTVFIQAPNTALAAGAILPLEAVVAPFYAGQVTYSWSPTEGLSCTDCLSPTFLASVSTQLAVEVATAGGCTATATLAVEVALDKNVYLPNAFTPDNDGINDYLQVFAGAGVREIHTFLVFDRWGGLVYDRAQDPSGKGWDGRLNNRPMPAGVYTVLVDLEWLDGAREQIGESVTLVR